MAKRFTATEKWDDAWFWNLSQTDKLFWGYVCDKCDHAGIWEANWSLTILAIGGNPDMSKFSERMIKISNDKFFIPRFLRYQYGNNFQKSQDHVRKSIIARLSALGIDPETLSPSGAPQEPHRSPTGNGKGNGNGKSKGNGYGFGEGNGLGNRHRLRQIGQRAPKTVS